MSWRFSSHTRPDGWLKSHVSHYVESLRREGIAIALIVNTDMPLMFRKLTFCLALTASMFARNKAMILRPGRTSSKPGRDH